MMSGTCSLQPEIIVIVWVKRNVAGGLAAACANLSKLMQPLSPSDWLISLEQRFELGFRTLR